MPTIGSSFSQLQAQTLKDARLVDRKVTEGGKDGVWSLPVKDTRELYDVNGDGKADVALVTREQDTGAWSYDGQRGVTHRELQLLDGQGRITDRFEATSVHRKDGKIVNELRGAEELTDLVGYIEHTDFLSNGQRSVTWDAAWSAKDDGQGKAVIDPAKIQHATKLYP
jgi:hypothetical protein